MDSSPAIHSTWITNQEPPRIQTLDEARPHTLKQHAAAEHIKQRLAQSIGTQRTGESDRVRAVKDEAQLRLLLALLQCPDTELPLVFAHDAQHLYDPACHCPRDILKDNQFLCAKARELVEFWMGPFNLDFETRKNRDEYRDEYMFWNKAELSGKQFPEIVVRGYRCVFTHHTDPVETAHIIPEQITQLDAAGYPHQLEAFTTLLSYVFPAKIVDDRAIKDLLSGCGLPNIIPLYMSSHGSWDRFFTNLRPISPADEAGNDEGTTTMKLQFLHFNNKDPAFADTVYDGPGVRTEQVDWWDRPGVAKEPP
ncbi:hypothetical protein PG984_011875 [Apiospora sp. TS-2023a]